MSVIRTICKLVYTCDMITVICERVYIWLIWCAKRQALIQTLVYEFDFCMLQETHEKETTIQCPRYDCVSRPNKQGLAMKWNKKWNAALGVECKWVQPWWHWDIGPDKMLVPNINRMIKHSIKEDFKN